MLVLASCRRKTRKGAIKKHIADAHPGETLRSLASLAKKGGKNEGVSKNLQRVHATVRKKTFKTHDVVRIVPHERKERGLRGDLYLCKVCLTLMGKKSKPESKLTCKQRLRKLKDNEPYNRIRRTWWRRVRQSEPRLAQSVSEVLGRSFEIWTKLVVVIMTLQVPGDGSAFRPQRKMTPDGVCRKRGGAVLLTVCHSRLPRQTNVMQV